MNKHPVYPAPASPISAQLLARMDANTARLAHHTYLHCKRRAHEGGNWQWGADQAAALRDISMRSARTHLARVNGCDRPVSARGARDPKTPAAGEGVCRVAAAGANACDISTRLTLQQTPREAIG